MCWYGHRILIYRIWTKQTPSFSATCIKGLPCAGRSSYTTLAMQVMHLPFHSKLPEDNDHVMVTFQNKEGPHPKSGSLLRLIRPHTHQEGMKRFITYITMARRGAGLSSKSETGLRESKGRRRAWVSITVKVRPHESSLTGSDVNGLNLPVKPRNKHQPFSLACTDVAQEEKGKGKYKSYCQAVLKNGISILITDHCFYKSSWLPVC